MNCIIHEGIKGRLLSELGYVPFTGIHLNLGDFNGNSSDSRRACNSLAAIACTWREGFHRRGSELVNAEEIKRRREEEEEERWDRSPDERPSSALNRG